MRLVIFLLLTFLGIFLQAAPSSYLPSEKDITTQLKNNKIVELDMNGNGKPDYFREFDEEGKLRFIRYDYNEDGKPEFQIELDANGFKKEEYIDRNYDGKVDYKVICSAKECVKYLDTKFDGNFSVDGKGSPERYAQAGKDVDEFKIFLAYKKILHKP